MENCCNDNNVPQIIDFDGVDFNWNDFLTGIPSILFRNFLFSRLPNYFKANDSYKNKEDEGLLERFMKVMGEELDDNVYPLIYNYLDILDAKKTPAKYLNHLSDTLGNPPDIFGADRPYRNMLSYITAIYKIKGTKKAYELFFSILGFDIIINEIIPETTQSLYDYGGIYDNDNIFENATVNYDETACPTCTYYDIALYPRNNDIDDVSYGDDFYNRVLEAIKFNEPINSKVRNIYLGIRVEDNMAISINDTTDIITRVTPTYDSTNNYDEELEYDEYDGQNIGVIINGIVVNMVQEGSGYKLVMKIPESNQQLDTDVPLILKAYNSDAEEVYNIAGVLEDIIIGEGYISGTIIQPLIFIPNYNELRLEGEIKTANGLTAVFNIPINLGDNNFTLTLQ